MAVTISEDCIGCGTCENISSDVFEMQDDGLAHVIGDEAGHEAEVDEAIESCPVSAISK